MNESPVIISIFTFLCVLVTYLVVDSLVRLPRLNKSDYPGYASLPQSLRTAFPLVFWGAEVFGERLARMRPIRVETLRKQLMKANVPLTPAMILGGQAALATAGVVAALFLFAISANAKVSLILGVLMAFCGWFFPAMTLESSAEERSKQIIRGLPFAIDLIGSAMHAGLDFNAAVRYYVGLGLKTPVTEEFSVMLKEAELGKSRIEALQSMAERVQAPVFTAFVDAVAHGIEVGASLVGTMRMQGEDMRRARFHLAEDKAARAPSIMIVPMAIFIMPAVFAIVLVPVFLRFKAAKGG